MAEQEADVPMMPTAGDPLKTHDLGEVCRSDRCSTCVIGGVYAGSVPAVAGLDAITAVDLHRRQPPRPEVAARGRDGRRDTTTLRRILVAHSTARVQGASGANLAPLTWCRGGGKSNRLRRRHRRHTTSIVFPQRSPRIGGGHRRPEGIIAAQIVCLASSIDPATGPHSETNAGRPVADTPKARPGGWVDRDDVRGVGRLGKRRPRPGCATSVDYHGVRSPGVPAHGAGVGGCPVRGGGARCCDGDRSKAYIQ